MNFGGGCTDSECVLLVTSTEIDGSAVERTADVDNVLGGSASNNRITQCADQERISTSSTTNCAVTDDLCTVDRVRTRTKDDLRNCGVLQNWIESLPELVTIASPEPNPCSKITTSAPAPRVIAAAVAVF